MKRTYRSIEHTGDLGVEVEADDLETLFTTASWALTDTLVEAGKITAHFSVQWSLKAETPEGLLVRQLEEILYQFDANAMIFNDFRISISSEWELACTAYGETLDRQRHGFKTELKAVTYHQLKIQRTPKGCWSARIIFDV